MSSIVINVPTRASVAVETKDLLFLWLAYLNNKSNLDIFPISLDEFCPAVIGSLTTCLQKLHVVLFHSSLYKLSFISCTTEMPSQLAASKAIWPIYTELI